MHSLYRHFFIKKKVTVGQNNNNNNKKKRNIPIYFSTNYRAEIKLVPIIMDYSLLQFHALNLFLGVNLHRGSLPNLNFSM